MLKVVFAGTPDFACPSLQALIDEKIKILAVYTQPDRRAGRGRKLTPSPVKQLAEQNNIPVFQPDSLKDVAEHDMLKALDADLMVVAAYGLILPQAVLDIPRYGCINVHASLLPRWRGAAPIQRAIQAGDKKSGICIMQMEAGLDTGPVLTNIACPIKDTDTAQDLHDRLSQLGAEALLIAIDNIESGRARADKQDDNKATYAAKLQKAEASLDWTLSAEQLCRNIRAFNPWPIAQSILNEQVIRIHDSVVIDNQLKQAKPGEIIAANADGVDVATGCGLLRILKCQLPGGKVLSVADLLNARKALFVAGASFATDDTLFLG